VTILAPAVWASIVDFNMSGAAHVYVRKPIAITRVEMTQFAFQNFPDSRTIPSAAFLMCAG
jgi:hypothetical protein